MARAKSPEKRQALLDAAIRAIAEQGLTASTSKIAKEAEVAEGTLFTYFETKDVLLNELYLLLKDESRAIIVDGFPHSGPLRARIQHVWNGLLHWGLNFPDRRSVSVQLTASNAITLETKAKVEQMYTEVRTAMSELDKHGSFAQCPPGFCSSAIVAMAEATMEQIMKRPSWKKRLVIAGFEAFWRMVE